jgi:hypothetical protein
LTSRILRTWVAVLLAWTLPVQAQFVDPSRNWRTFDTANYTLHFAEEHRAQAQVVAGIAEKVHARVTAWLQWRPESRTHLVLLDSADFSNGWASRGASTGPGRRNGICASGGRSERGLTRFG